MAQLEETTNEDFTFYDEEPDDTTESMEEIQEIDEPKLKSKKKGYVLTEARKSALQKAREKKSNYNKLGKEVVKTNNKKFVEKVQEDEQEEDEKADEIPVKKPVQRPVKVKKEIVHKIDEDDEEINDRYQRLKEDEIREYLRYKKQEAEEYRRTLMIKSQIDKEKKYKKAFASVFGYN